jgi:flagellar basal-body rod protein FlgG
MLDGLYSAASGMEAQQQQIDAIAGDLANMNTAGYQASKLDFHDLLYTSGGLSSGSAVVTGAGVAAQEVGRSQVQGAMQHTGRSLDVAIVGDGYLEVRRADGTIGLTRNGVLETDAQGQLTDAQGRVLQPPITIPRGISPENVTIEADGSVLAGTRRLGQIALVTVPAPDRLLPAGDSLFSANLASGAIRPASGATLRQGMLEASNVDVSSEMVGMIDAQRGYSMASKAIQFQDQMLQIANQVKR